MDITSIKNPVTIVDTGFFVGASVLTELFQKLSNITVYRQSLDINYIKKSPQQKNLIINNEF